MSDKTISPEIIKLMDKMTQNPTSRLFVPLAEEYLKCDMVDEAVIVLVEGIKSHPNYVAARVMLGKIYLQKNRIAEAQAEFEQVIAINPENILAHKRLATIYQGQGQTQRALEACKKVLMIDPSDKEAKGLVGVLEKASISSAPPESASPPSIAPVAAEQAPLSGNEMKEADMAPPVELAPVEEVSVQVSPQEMPIEEAPMPIESPAPSAESVLGVQEEPVIPSLTDTSIPEVIENQAVTSGGVVQAAPPVVAEENLSVQEDSWEGDKTVVAGFEIPSMVKEPPSSHDVEASSTPDKNDRKEDPLLSPTLASLYMSQGHYQKAADVYQKLLARDPSDEESRQGLNKALQALAPKQGEEAVSQESSGPDDPKKKKAQRLQSWLDSIRKKNEP
jgi:tetratricopeptide (TPR) repeat protein